MRVLRTVLLLLFGGLLAVAAGCASLKTPVFSTDDGAIRGYDPVAYHTEHRPVKGDAAYRYHYNDATWYFASEENLALFRSDPERYTPQYGGYCAYAMSKGYVVSTDPEAWYVERDKLYLNFSKSVRETWLEDIPGYVAKADGHWQQKLAQPGFE